jgi:hypothetical protein
MHSSFMCNWVYNVSNHFVYMLEKQEGFYSEYAKQGAYKGKGGILDDQLNPFTVDDDYGVGSFPDLSQKNDLARASEEFTKKEPESGKNCDETSRAGEEKYDDKNDKGDESGEEEEAKVIENAIVNSLTAIGPYMAHRFFWLCSRLITF